MSCENCTALTELALNCEWCSSTMGCQGKGDLFAACSNGGSWLKAGGCNTANTSMTATTTAQGGMMSNAPTSAPSVTTASASPGGKRKCIVGTASKFNATTAYSYECSAGMYKREITKRERVASVPFVYDFFFFVIGFVCAVYEYSCAFTGKADATCTSDFVAQGAVLTSGTCADDATCKSTTFSLSGKALADRSRCCNDKDFCNTIATDSSSGNKHLLFLPRMLILKLLLSFFLLILF